MHLVAAYLPHQGVVLAQVAVEMKDNEMVVAPTVLNHVADKPAERWHPADVHGSPAIGPSDNLGGVETDPCRLVAPLLAKRAAILEEAERYEHADPVDGRGADLRDLESRFNIGKALSEHMVGKLTGAEAEFAAEKRSGRKDALAVPVTILLGERRALTTAAPGGGPGSNLVQTSRGPMVDRLRPLLAVETLGATVAIETRKAGAGRVVIHYTSLEELEGLLQRFRR